MTRPGLRHSAMVLGVVLGFAGHAAAQPFPSTKPLPAIEIMPADSRGGLRVAPAPRLEPCPLFLSLDDPAHCHIGLTPSGVSEAAGLQNPAGLPVTLLALDEAMLGLTGDTPLLTPQLPIGDAAPGPRLGLTVSGIGQPARNTAPQANAMQATYDVPVLNRLNVSSSSKVSQGPDLLSAETRTNSAKSKFGLVYEDYGVTVKIDPDISASWGDAVADQMQYGVTNQIVTSLASDLTLTLTSAYSAFSYPGEPLQNRSATRNRLALAYAYGDGYRLGLSAHSRNEQNHWEDRNLVGPGLSFTMPLSDRFSLTANSEFSIVQRDLQQVVAVTPPSTFQQSFGLQTKWEPSAFASHAMSIITGYTLSYDSAPPVGLASYSTLARVALAMKF